jgi:hypothetical protein
MLFCAAKLEMSAKMPCRVSFGGLHCISVILRTLSLYNRKMDIEDLLEEPVGIGDYGILFSSSVAIFCRTASCDCVLNALPDLHFLCIQPVEKAHLKCAHARVNVGRNGE